MKQLHKLGKNGVLMAWICAGVTSIAACSGSSSTEGTGSSATAPVGDVQAHLDANPKIKETARMLASEGWALRVAKVEKIGDEAAALGEGVGWTRVRVDVSRNADSAANGALIVAWREGAEDVVAIDTKDEATREALNGALDAAEATAAVDATETLRSQAEKVEERSAEPAVAAACVVYSDVCSANSQCCSGLACNLPFIGPQAPGQNLHRCGCANPKTITYTEKIGTSVACFNLPDNPTGAAFWTRSKTGCGDALCGTAKGCGRACPSHVLKTSLSIECGIYNAPC